MGVVNFGCKRDLFETVNFQLLIDLYFQQVGLNVYFLINRKQADTEKKSNGKN